DEPKRRPSAAGPASEEAKSTSLGSIRISMDFLRSVEIAQFVLPKRHTALWAHPNKTSVLTGVPDSLEVVARS
ncbi:hypothetical protein NDU88_001163, partial [Pleurodeles waltl]